jgi:hypothetical protein
MAESLVRNEEATGSIPVSSTMFLYQSLPALVFPSRSVLCRCFCRNAPVCPLNWLLLLAQWTARREPSALLEASHVNGVRSKQGRFVLFGKLVLPGRQR